MAFCEPAEVVWVTRISPSVIRVRLRAVGPWRWFTDGRGDERIDLAFPRPGEVAADVSYFNDQHAGITRQDSSPPWRHYTTRKVHGDGAEFDVDFVMHDGGVAARWARSAEPGNVLGVFRARRPPARIMQPPSTRSGSCSLPMRPGCQASPESSRNCRRVWSYTRSWKCQPRRTVKRLQAGARSPGPG